MEIAVGQGQALPLHRSWYWDKLLPATTFCIALSDRAVYYVVIRWPFTSCQPDQADIEVQTVNTIAKEPSRETNSWNERQGIFSFVLLIALCLSFYAMGLYVGRWSNMPAQSAAKADVNLNNTPTVSAAAATPLEVTANGTEEKPATLPLPTGERYSVQVATADTQIQADAIVEKLRRAGFESVHAVAPEPNSVAQFYTVRVGPYDVDTARQVADELQREHGYKAVQVMPRQVE
jgi:hypothetical protein